MKLWQNVCVRHEKPRISNLSSCGYKTTVSEGMEWYQVVKLPSVTIPCFFRLLFVGRKRQGLNLRKNRLIEGQIETKAKNDCDYRKDAFACKCMHMMRLHANLPPFLPPLSPTTPITPYNPPNSPLKQINCLRPPRQNGATTATTESDNQMFFKGSFSLQLSISKAIPLASRADRRRELA